MYPATLLNSFISANDFCGLCRNFYMKRSCHLWTEIILLLPFQSVFSCLIALARISNTTLKRSGESEFPCLNHNLKGKTFSLSMFSMFAVGFSYVAFIIVRKLPFTLVCWVFLSEKVVEFYQMLFPHQLIWTYGFCPWFC